MKRMTMRVLPLVFVLLASRLNIVSAQNDHCPAMRYEGTRPEWTEPFQTNGLAGRKVFFAETGKVTVEDWCQTQGQGLVPFQFVQLLHTYQNTPGPQPGDPVSRQVTIHSDTWKIEGISEVGAEETLPPLSTGGSIIRLDLFNNDHPFYLTLFKAKDSPQMYLQTPDGEIWRVTF